MWLWLCVLRPCAVNRGIDWGTIQGENDGLNTDELKKALKSSDNRPFCMKAGKRLQPAKRCLIQNAKEAIRIIQSGTDRRHCGGRHVHGTFSRFHRGGWEKMGASPRPDGICHQHKHMVLLDIGHSWAFLRKLAPKYPARQKEILAQRKLYVIPDKWCGQKREKKY